MVIQRWQSLLLLFAAALALIFSFCRIATIEGATQSVEIFSYGVYNVPAGTSFVGSIYVTVVAILAALLSLVNIFLFKNTRLQKRVCMFVLVLLVAACCSEYLVIEGLDIPGAQGVNYNTTSAFSPFVAMLAVIGAYRCIRSDERKLAAADRLR